MSAAVERLKARQVGLNAGYNPLDVLAPALPARGDIIYLNEGLLHDFSGHTFKQRSGEYGSYAQALFESIKENGVMEPLVVRRHPTISGEYEIIAGHTRRRIGKDAGVTEFPCIVENLDDDEAVIYMTESNIQRPGWLPSEKAASYKAHYGATERLWKKKPGRPKKGSQENAGTEFPHFSGDRLRDVVARRFGISGRTLDIYVKLLDLTPALLGLVDEGRILVKAGYQLSFLSPFDQEALGRILLQYPHIKVDENKAVDLRKCERARWRRILGLEKDEKPKKMPTRSLALPEHLICVTKDQQERALARPEFQRLFAEFINSTVPQWAGI